MIFLGIDLGTSSLKAVLVDDFQAVFAEAAVPIGRRTLGQAGRNRIPKIGGSRMSWACTLVRYAGAEIGPAFGTARLHEWR